MSAHSSGQCLVARPHIPNGHIEKNMADNEKEAEMAVATDRMVQQLGKLKIDKSKSADHGKTGHNKDKHGSNKTTSYQNPANFLHMQSLRTSALAHKTNTTTKFGGSTNTDLFATLLNKDSETPKTTNVVKPKENQDSDKNAIKTADAVVSEVPKKDSDCLNDSVDSGKVSGEDLKTDGDVSDGELIGRQPGPIRGARCTTYSTKHSPYQQMLQQQQQPQHAYSFNRHGVPTHTMPHSEYMQNGYEQNGEHQWVPPCIDSPKQYATPPPHPQFMATQAEMHPFADSALTSDDLNRLLETPKELPEALSDFILKYSRRYTAQQKQQQQQQQQDANEFAEMALRHAREKRKDSDASSESSQDGSAMSEFVQVLKPEETRITFLEINSSDKGSPSYHRQSSVDGDSGIDSPMSVNSIARVSPAAPKGGHTPTTPTNTSPPHTVPNLSPNRGSTGRERLRALISDREMDSAWAWTCKCTQSCPGAIYYCDPDGDSLLHIVVWHRDISKTYALVEQMLKQEALRNVSTETRNYRKPFDLPNRMQETPLFLAVEKRCVDIVRYLLEVGCDPNFATKRPERDAPIHYAASRGMTEIVETLCTHNGVALDNKNGMGLTALLCAVRNHGVIEEDSQCLVNNKPTIRALLKAGANPHVADITNGKTVLHYAVERMDPDLVEIFGANLEPDSMRQLCALRDFNNDTPLQLLQRINEEHETGQNVGALAMGRLEAEEELRKKMQHTLVAAGAQV